MFTALPPLKARRNASIASTIGFVGTVVPLNVLGIIGLAIYFRSWRDLALGFAVEVVALFTIAFGAGYAGATPTSGSIGAIMLGTAVVMGFYGYFRARTSNHKLANVAVAV